MTAPINASANPSSAAPSGTTQFASLYVGDLDPHVTEQILFTIFNAIGPVASIRVCRDSISRRSLGYAYVNFHNAADAERALSSLNYTQIKGRCCRIMWSHRDPALRRSGNGNVFVKNLDKSIDNKALNDTFSLFGNIISCKVATDYEGKSRGFGFVHFENEESAKAAIEKLNGMQLGEKVVYVGEFLKNSARESDGTTKPFSNVYIKHLPQSITEEKLSNLFSKFGEITSTYISEDNKGRRFAFLNFENFDSAARAVQEMHGVDVRTAEEKEMYESAKEQEKATKKEEGKDVTDDEIIRSLDDDDVPETQLYVSKAMTKIARQKFLKNQYYAKTSATTEVGSVVVPAAGSNLYVKNFGEEVDDEALKTMFSNFGAIISAKVSRDAAGASRGFGYVCFSHPEEATKAVTEMHLKLINGKPLYVGLHEKKEQRIERLQNHYRAGNPMGGMGQFNGAPRSFGSNSGLYQGQNSNGMYGPGSFGPRPGMNPAAAYGAPGMGGRGMPGMGMGAFGPGPQAARMPYPGSAGMMAPQLRGPSMYGKGKGGMPGGPMPVGPQMSAGPRAPIPGSIGTSGMGLNRPMMQQNRPAMPGIPQNQMFDSVTPLTAAALAAAPPQMQKQMLGEKLFPLVSRVAPDLAGKITGMMLEMDNSELLILLESEGQLRYKIDEAVRVLDGKM